MAEETSTKQTAKQNISGATGRLDNLLVGGKIEGLTKAKSSAQGSLDALLAEQKQLQIDRTEFNKDRFDSEGAIKTFSHQKQENSILGRIGEAKNALGLASSNLENPENTLSATDRGLLKGSRFGAALLGDEGLGRLGNDEAIQSLDTRFQDLSQGFNAKELTAQREQGLEGISATSQAQQRALLGRLGASGVKGGLAGSQIRDVSLGALQQRRGLERDLLGANLDRKTAGLENLAKFQTGVRTFDLGQAAKEKDIILQSATGTAQGEISQEVAKLQADSAAKAAKARAAASGGKK